MTISELFITIINNKIMKNSIKNDLKNSIFGQKSQKNICYTEIHTPVEEFMRFEEELIFAGVNHPSYLFSNIVKKIIFFSIKVVYFNNFSILTHRRGYK